MTENDTVQMPEAGIVPFERATLEPPGTAATIPAPHVVAAPGDAATDTPAGRLSVRAAAVRRKRWSCRS